MTESIICCAVPACSLADVIVASHLYHSFYPLWYYPSSSSSFAQLFRSSASSSSLPLSSSSTSSSSIVHPRCIASSLPYHHNHFHSRVACVCAVDNNDNVASSSSSSSSVPASSSSSSASPSSTSSSSSADASTAAPVDASSTPIDPSIANHRARRNASDRSPRDNKQSSKLKTLNSNMLQYLFGLAVLTVGLSWASVPLYRAFCAHTGYGGTTQQDKDASKLANLTPSNKQVTVTFNADTNPAMHWKFTPSQSSVKIKLGEPVLAFYKATNLRDKAVTGVATYNVTPMKAGLYFHKIQCFCFDEQRLRANETVDMPVFFYIDPAMETDHRTRDITTLTLSYTFFPVEDDEDDTRTEAEKDAAMIGIRTHLNDALPSNAPKAVLDAAKKVEAEAKAIEAARERTMRK